MSYLNCTLCNERPWRFTCDTCRAKICKTCNTTHCCIDANIINFESVIRNVVSEMANDCSRVIDSEPIEINASNFVEKEIDIINNYYQQTAKKLELRNLELENELKSMRDKFNGLEIQYSDDIKILSSTPHLNEQQEAHYNELKNKVHALENQNKQLQQEISLKIENKINSPRPSAPVPILKPISSIAPKTTAVSIRTIKPPLKKKDTSVSFVAQTAPRL